MLHVIADSADSFILTTFSFRYCSEFWFFKFNHFVDSSIVYNQFLHTEKNRNDRSKLITLIISLSEDIWKFEKKNNKKNDWLIEGQ